MIIEEQNIIIRRRFFMQYGHFDDENREYVIDRIDLPTSWTNYLGVEKFATVINHTAG